MKFLKKFSKLMGGDCRDSFPAPSASSNGPELSSSLEANFPQPPSYQHFTSSSVRRVSLHYSPKDNGNGQRIDKLRRLKNSTSPVTASTAAMDVNQLPPMYPIIHHLTPIQLAEQRSKLCRARSIILRLSTYPLLPVIISGPMQYYIGIQSPSVSLEMFMLLIPFINCILNSLFFAINPMFDPFWIRLYYRLFKHRRGSINSHPNRAQMPIGCHHNGASSGSLIVQNSGKQHKPMRSIGGQDIPQNYHHSNISGLTIITESNSPFLYRNRNSPYVPVYCCQSVPSLTYSNPRMNADTSTFTAVTSIPDAARVTDGGFTFIPTYYLRSPSLYQEGADDVEDGLGSGPNRNHFSNNDINRINNNNNKGRCNTNNNSKMII